MSIRIAQLLSFHVYLKKSYRFVRLHASGLPKNWNCPSHLENRLIFGPPLYWLPLYWQTLRKGFICRIRNNKRELVRRYHGQFTLCDVLGC
jgi:hypothetical protein